MTKRLRKQIEAQGWFQYEGWKAPVYKPGKENDFSATVQVTWHP